MGSLGRANGGYMLKYQKIMMFILILGFLIIPYQNCDSSYTQSNLYSNNLDTDDLDECLDDPSLCDDDANIDLISLNIYANDPLQIDASMLFYDLSGSCNVDYFSSNKVVATMLDIASNEIQTLSGETTCQGEEFHLSLQASQLAQYQNMNLTLVVELLVYDKQGTLYRNVPRAQKTLSVVFVP